MHGEGVFVFDFAAYPNCVCLVGMLNRFSEFVVLCIVSWLKMGLQKDDLRLFSGCFLVHKNRLLVATTKRDFFGCHFGFTPHVLDVG